MKNFKYWLVIIIRTIISAATFFFLSMLFGKIEVKAEVISNSNVGFFEAGNDSKLTYGGGINVDDAYSGVHFRGHYTSNFTSTSEVFYQFDYTIHLNELSGSDVSFYGLSFNRPLKYAKIGNNICNLTTTLSPSVYYFECNNLQNVTENYVRLYFDSSNSTGALRGGISNIVYTPSLSSKQDETNEKLDDINDNLTDDNVDGVQDSANGFFNSFENNDHGLSGIITSPLRLIQSFTNDTCTPVKFSVWGKDSELPCGSFMFDRSDVKPFINAFNIIVGGLICYGAVRGIHKKVDDFKNPDDSKVEVLDL